MVYVNKFIKNTERIFPEQGRYTAKRYDMNENPEGLPKEFVDSVLKEITPEFLSIYPEPDKFLNKYAKYIGKGTTKENYMATNGSDMAIRYLLETFGEVGKDVVTVTPSFEMYAVNCSILGLHHVAVAYNDDLTIDVDNILKAINENTRVVVLLNPNNPVGNVYSEEELKKIIAKAAENNAIVIIDEAYHYFYPNTFIDHALQDDNVVVLRTFSKLFSIAACRLGVIISKKENIHYLMNAKLTFDANSIALLFGERILDHPELIDELIRIENEGKKYTFDSLKEHGYSYRDCRGNFIFIEPHHDAKNVAERLEKEENVLVHPYGNPVLKKYLRVSIGSAKAMKIFLDAFYRIDA